MGMATLPLFILRPSQLRALLTGLLLGTGTGALAGWPAGVGVGVALTALLLMPSFLSRPAIGGGTRSKPVSIPIVPDGVEVYRVSDALLIHGASTFLETLRGTGQEPRVLILDLTAMDWIDATALRIIKQTFNRGSHSGVLMLVAGGGLSITEALRRSGSLPESVVFDSLDDAAQRARIHLMRDGANRPRR